MREAAYIDGCGFFARFWHIILPLSRTGIVTAATFEFLTCWNEFVFANLIVSSKAAHDPGRHTLLYQSVLDRLRLHVRGDRHFDNPSILGYVLFQEQIISGMTSGAVKG